MIAKVRLIPPAPDSEPPDAPRSRPMPGWGKAALVTLAAAACLAFFLYHRGAEQRAIRELPVAERRALFERTLENLRSVCAPAEDSMRSFCLDQARLAEEFPECDSACRNLADRQLARLQLPR